MAAKLKKRALAEYQSQTLVIEPPTAAAAIGSRHRDSSASGSDNSLESCRKRLRLVLQRDHSRDLAGHGPGGAAAGGGLFPLDRLESDREVIALLISTVSKLPKMTREQLTEVGQKVLEATTSGVKMAKSSATRQLLLTLDAILAQEKSEDVRIAARNAIPSWLSILENGSLAEKDDTLEETLNVALLGTLACCHRNQIEVSPILRSRILPLIKIKLRSRHVSVRIAALKVIGDLMVHSPDLGTLRKCLKITGQFTHSPEPRVRREAFAVLLLIHKDGRQRLDQNMYSQYVAAIKDDYDGVRMAALQLVHALAETYPNAELKASKNLGELRLVDDAFGQICGSITDRNVQVREMAAKLMGSMEQVSQHFLEQTLDKKLMSNLRLKRSAHERESKLVSSGEWSSGKFRNLPFSKRFLVSF